MGDCHLGCHIMGASNDVVGARRVNNSCDQLLVQAFPVEDSVSVIYAEAVDRTLNWDIQNLQLLLKKCLLAPISLLL